MNLGVQVLVYLRKNACGRDRARSAGEIAAEIGSTDRAVRAAIHDLRADGLAIASSVDSSGGFFVPLTQEEAAACSRHLWTRVEQIAKIARRFDSATRAVGLKPADLRQLRLFEDERQVYQDVG